MAEDEVTPESSVSLPVGQLLDGIERRIDKRLDHQDATSERIERRLENTVTREDLHAVELRLGGRVDDHEERITDLEAGTMTKDAVLGHKRHTWQVIGYVAALGVAVATAVGTDLLLFHH